MDIRLMCLRAGKEDEITGFKNTSKIVAPGDQIDKDATSFMGGHGTFRQNASLYSSVAGIIKQTNKLISVKPLKTRYNGEIGDCIVGRITEVQQKRWKVETNSRLDSVLQLSSVNLPDGELRRRSEEDMLIMRQYLKEGDLISAEIKEIFSDGSLSLHTRTGKYGKLSEGTLVKVSPSLIKRSKTHFHSLPCGVKIIIGNNGFIWVSPTVLDDADDGACGDRVTRDDREMVARVRNCILALGSRKMILFDTSIILAYDASLLHYEKAKDLLTPDAIDNVVMVTRRKLKELEED